MKPDINNTAQPGADDAQGINLAAARAGDQDAFEALVLPHRRELLVHCYRILGSFEDAEDMLQETLLRAWKHLDRFEGRSRLRTWLYKIATNACLDALDSRKRRGLMNELYPLGDPAADLPPASKEAVWVEPFPDEFIDGQPDTYPEASYELRESVTLAFVAALQTLPGRQRAVLILCDVLGWQAAEAGEILDMTTAAVNSALQRAREGMKQRNLPPAAPRLNDQLKVLLAQYVAAWEAADSAALVATLREDVALTMPPYPLWFHGRTDVRSFLDRQLFAQPALRLRLVPLRANGSPAFAVYQLDGSGTYRPAAIHVLTVRDGVISEVHDFLVADARLFSRFGLPPVLDR